MATVVLDNNAQYGIDWDKARLKKQEWEASICERDKFSASKSKSCQLLKCAKELLLMNMFLHLFTTTW